MPWVFGGFTVPSGHEPWAAGSDLPEDQEDLYSEFQPVGNTATNSTIITYQGSKSREISLFMRVNAATLASLRALKRTTFTLKTPWDTTGFSVYMKRIEARRWTRSQPPLPLTADILYVTIELVAR